MKCSYCHAWSLAWHCQPLPNQARLARVGSPPLLPLSVADSQRPPPRLRWVNCCNPHLDGLRQVLQESLTTLTALTQDALRLGPHSAPAASLWTDGCHIASAGSRLVTFMPEAFPATPGLLERDLARVHQRLFDLLEAAEATSMTTAEPGDLVAANLEPAHRLFLADLCTYLQKVGDL